MKIIITEEQYGFIEGIEIGDDGQMKLDVKGREQKKSITCFTIIKMK